MPVKIPINSRYRNTAVVRFKGVDTFGMWKGFDWKNTAPTLVVVVKSGDAGRWDLLANKYLGTTDLWWALMYYNNRTDINGPKAGDTINIPSMITVLSQ
jgi:hypothetical protein